MQRRVGQLLVLGALAGVLVGGSRAAAQSPETDGEVAPIVGSWQITANTPDFEFYVQYTFVSDGIVWVFVPDGRHGSGVWEETAPGEVTMSFVIQSGSEDEIFVERIWERFPMPEPGADTWSADFSYYVEDIDGNVLEGGPAGSVVARRVSLRADLGGLPVAPSPAPSNGVSGSTDPSANP
jgi:hypothetical protein